MFEIIEKNDDFIVVIKPPGIGFHDEEEETTGFFNLLRKQLDFQIFSVHRLDKVTSGLIIMARTQEAASIFGELFQNHHVEKTYLAIAGNKPKKKQGLVKGDITKARRGAWKLEHTSANPSVTTFLSFSIIAGQRLYLLSPKTGKTHQLRVVMKSLGVPILGDTLYSGESSDRVYLHAYALKFTFKSKEFNFESYPKVGNLFILHKEKILEILDEAF